MIKLEPTNPITTTRSMTHHHNLINPTQPTTTTQLEPTTTTQLEREERREEKKKWESLREEREGRKQIASLFEWKEFFALWYAKIAF